MQLPRYSMGVGDRFALEGPAQLDALIEARRQGVDIAPVWNKSHREHSIVGSRPADVRIEADRAVAARGWTDPYFVDADHIGLSTVDGFLDSCDFFTLDVADWIGADAGAEAVDGFVERQKRLIGRLAIAGMERPLEISRAMLVEGARKFLAAARQAGRIYRRIEEAKKGQSPVIEVSLDETDRPQTPTELLLILAALAEEGIPAQTIAPRFTGRFNKGVDYVGDVSLFRQQFEEDLAVVAFAIREFPLPRNLKLSVHSGSDKFALYRPIRAALEQFDAGLHLKTAGTTWLEELIGLAAAGGEGLSIAKDVYREAWKRFDELCAPYASVVDIDRDALPSPDVVAGWDSNAYAAALCHNAACESYNPHLRQLLHVGYKVAAEMGNRFSDALRQYSEIIAGNVTRNLFERHVRPLFLGK
jgi:hypothetical protein